MTDATSETLSVVVERDIAYPPEKIWRALTQPHLIAEWLMKNDFAPKVDHRFKFSGDWGSVDCQVLTVEPNRSLSYSWGAFGPRDHRHLDPDADRCGDAPAHGTGRLPRRPAAVLSGRQGGVGNFFAKLEHVLARTD